MKNISLVLTIAALMACCDKDNYIDSGIHERKHDCTIWEYFKPTMRIGFPDRDDPPRKYDKIL